LLSKIAGFIRKLAKEFNPGPAGCGEWQVTAGIVAGKAFIDFQPGEDLTTKRSFRFFPDFK
jgi:hypothetical protein